MKRWWFTSFCYSMFSFSTMKTREMQSKLDSTTVLKLSWGCMPQTRPGYAPARVKPAQARLLYCTMQQLSCNFCKIYNAFLLIGVPRCNTHWYVTVCLLKVWTVPYKNNHLPPPSPKGNSWLRLIAPEMVSQNFKVLVMFGKNTKVTALAKNMAALASSPVSALTFCNPLHFLVPAPTTTMYINILIKTQNLKQLYQL